MVHFNGLDFRDCLRMEFGSGLFGKFRPDRWYRTRLVGYRQFQTVSFKPGFRPGKIGLRSGSICRNSTVFRCRILDRYRNERIAIDHRLPDNDRILTINRVQDTAGLTKNMSRKIGHTLVSDHLTLITAKPPLRIFPDIAIHKKKTPGIITRPRKIRTEQGNDPFKQITEYLLYAIKNTLENDR